MDGRSGAALLVSSGAFVVVNDTVMAGNQALQGDGGAVSYAPATPVMNLCNIDKGAPTDLTKTLAGAQAPSNPETSQARGTAAILD